jgi:hypothetical protein
LGFRVIGVGFRVEGEGCECQDLRRAEFEVCKCRVFTCIRIRDRSAGEPKIAPRSRNPRRVKSLKLRV